MDGEAALEKIGVGSAVILLGFGIGAVLEYLVKVVLARFLGPDIYGVFVQGLAVVQVMTVIALFGLHQSLPRFMSYYRGKGEEGMIGSSVATSLFLVLPSTIAATGVLFLSSEWLAVTVFSEPALVQPLQVFSLSILPMALFYLTIAFMRGMKNARYKVYVDDIVLPTAQLLLILAFLYLGYGLIGAVYAYLLALVVTLVAGCYSYTRISDIRLTGAELIPGKLLLFSWPLLVVSILLITGKWLDVIMLGWLKASLQVGIYEVAFAIAGVLGLLLSSLGYMFMPVISELYGAGNISRILELYRTITRWVFTITLPLLAGLLIFPSEILNVLFGPSYTTGATVLMVLAVGNFYLAGTGHPATILMAADRTERFMVSMGVSTSVNIFLNLLLIPRYGIMGAAVATTTALVVGNTLLLLFAWKEVGGFPYNRDFLRVFPGITVASALVYGVKMVLDPGLLASVALGALLVTIYVPVLYLSGGVHEEDFKMMRTLWSSLRR